MKFVKPAPLSLAKFPVILQSLKGDVVRHPPNACHTYDYPIGHVGLDAVKIFFEERNQEDRLRNQAQCHYLYMRDGLLKTHSGKWVAVSSNNSTFIDSHENVVRNIAEAVFRTSEEDYFVTCVGSEVLEMVDMGEGRYVVCDKEERTDELYMDAAYSLTDENSFIPTRMKLNTGAAMMGIPSSVIEKHKPPRGRDEICLGINGQRTKTKTYENVHFKVADKVFTTRAMETSTWVIGYPIWSNFNLSIDMTKEPAVTMTPRNV